ncbi:putative acyl-activating enzyme 17, peroxisomal [Artemisia annua]|uniref:Putative acyl-activating enzyme 17, peroxisomal n=1 Tax=Artemisia annua TaxID=35608 RepID=A0A2U1PN22_ARTAN|nr:putative acyl-activating enzyme 17, peroxisomal [Artemisia annua]
MVILQVPNPQFTDDNEIIEVLDCGLHLYGQQIQTTDGISKSKSTEDQLSIRCMKGSSHNADGGKAVDANVHVMDIRRNPSPRVLAADESFSCSRSFGSTGEASNADEYLWLMGRAEYKPVMEYCGGTMIGGGLFTGSLLQP